MSAKYPSRIASIFALVISVAFYFSFLLGCGSSNSHSGTTSGASSGSGNSGSSGGSGSGGSSSGSGTSGGSGGGTQAKAARFLYVTESAINAVRGFSIDSSTGTLTPVTQGDVKAGNVPVRLASDSNGKLLFVANQQSNNLSAFSIASDGALSPVSGSPFALGGHGVDVTVSPSGKWLFVAQDNGSGVVAVFSIASSGALTQVAGSPFPLQHGPRALITDPSGKFLYVASGPVEGFSIDQDTGALTPVPGEPFQVIGPANCTTCAGPAIAFNLAIDPGGAHLYTADSWAGSVDGFNIDPSTGSLTHMQGAPFVDRMPTGQSMDPSFNPYGIAIDGRDKFLYGYDSGDEDISFFPINASSGALGPVQKTSNTFGGVCAGQLIRADATGKFLYGLGSELSSCVGSVSVIGFSINQTNGTLTPIAKGSSASQTAVQSVPFNDGIALVP